MHLRAATPRPAASDQPHPPRLIDGEDGGNHERQNQERGAFEAVDERRKTVLDNADVRLREQSLEKCHDEEEDRIIGPAQDFPDKSWAILSAACAHTGLR